MPRLFLSVNLPHDIQRELARFQRKMVDLFKGNLVPEADLHITLKFLGEVKPEQIEQIKSICLTAIPTPSFTVELKGISVFPSVDRIRVVWTGIGVGREALASIRAALDERLDVLGFGDDKPFSAHVTLARVKKVIHRDALRQLIKNNHDTWFGKFRVEHVDLMQSELSKTGAAHSELASFTLN